MKLLAIETSSARLSLAAGNEQKVVKTYQGPLEWRHAESLFEGMQKVLQQARWPVQQLTGVVVSVGPGSFTGIRIGLAAARALGQSLKVPVVGVSSLDALGEEHLAPGLLVCPIINALRGDVFTALYQQDARGNRKTLWKETRLPIPELIDKLSSFARQPLLFVGDATAIYKEALQKGRKSWRVASGQPRYPAADVLLQIGKNRLKNRAHSFESVVPLYLRSASAVERRQLSK